VVGLRTTGLREVHLDDQMVALRLLSARRRDLVRSRTQAVNRLHQTLMELIPAGAPRGLTAGRARELLAAVRPRDIAGRTRRQVAVDLIDDVVVLDRKLKAIETRIKDAVAATGTTLTDIVGVGPITAAVINTSSLGMVRQWQTLFYDGRYSNTDLHSGAGRRIPDFAKLADAYGCVGLRCESEADLDATIEKAMGIDDVPVVIDFVVHRDAMVWPMVAAGSSNSDIQFARDIAPSWDRGEEEDEQESGR